MVRIGNNGTPLPASAAGVSNTRSPSPTPPVAIELSARGKLTKEDKKRIHDETGRSINEVKQDVRWRRATTDLQAIGSSARSLFGPKATGRDRMAGFIEHVVNDRQTEVKHDPIDASYQTHSVPVNGTEVTLSLTDDVNGNLHVNAFVTALKKNPAVERACQELKDQGWTLCYGAPNQLDPQAKTITINPADPKATLKGLWRSLQQVEFEGGKRPVAVTVERMYQHFRDNDPTVSPVRPQGRFGRMQSKVLYLHGKNDGFYNAVTRMVQDPDVTDPRFIPAEHPDNVTLHDAVMVNMYRLMFEPLNAALRSQDPQTRNPALDMRDEINASLAKLGNYKGDALRQIGGAFSPEGPITEATIQAYERQIGRVITEPAFMSATIMGSDVDQTKYEGNVHFVIGSKHGKVLGSLSPHDEILFLAERQYKLLDVLRWPTKAGQPPTAQIQMDEV